MNRNNCKDPQKPIRGAETAVSLPISYHENPFIHTIVYTTRPTGSVMILVEEILTIVVTR